MTNNIRGKFITALGLPCSGKSTVMGELGKIIKTRAIYLEPEECLWPKAVTHRNQLEYFSCLMWFRSIRVPMLYEAHKLRETGKIVITDCYFDKILKHYIGQNCTEWLFKKNDPYYEAVLKIAATDWEILPNADYVVVFIVRYQDWITMLKKRDRAFDTMADVNLSYESQEKLLEIADKLEKEKGIKKIIFEQSLSSPYLSAVKLYHQLIEYGILKEKSIKITEPTRLFDTCLA